MVLASLNHPNIAAIHGFEDSSDIHALVLDLVEGPTLADRIKQGPIPVDEALEIATQIAAALNAAHERGIVHRDLKPANIKLTDEGIVKVLDFGLAKALESESTAADISMSPTMSIAATRMGVILGTAAYMAPEQARGKTVDKRADIWAFGCVLYEMLTGKRAFEGEDATETIAAVVKGEPDWNALPAEVPGSIRTLLKACLAKDPPAAHRGCCGGSVRTRAPGKPGTSPAVTKCTSRASRNRAAKSRSPQLAARRLDGIAMAESSFSRRQIES